MYHNKVALWRRACGTWQATVLRLSVLIREGGRQLTVRVWSTCYHIPSTDLSCLPRVQHRAFARWIHSCKASRPPLCVPCAHGNSSLSSGSFPCSHAHVLTLCNVQDEAFGILKVRTEYSTNILLAAHLVSSSSTHYPAPSGHLGWQVPAPKYLYLKNLYDGTIRHATHQVPRPPLYVATRGIPPTVCLSLVCCLSLDCCCYIKACIRLDLLALQSVSNTSYLSILRPHANLSNKWQPKLQAMLNT